MPYYENGQTTRRARGGGRQSDLLMQQLGMSTSDSAKDSSPANDFEELGLDNNSTTSSAPLTFDASTDTRKGNPRKRRGNGSHLGNASSQQQAQARPHAAGMIRNDEEVARRQQIIQDVAAEDMFRPSSRRTRATAPTRSASVSAPSRTPQSVPMRRNAESQPAEPVAGIDTNPNDATPEGNQGILRSNPLTERIKGMRGRQIINPITFIRENGGGVETFGIWLYEYRQVFVLLAIIFLIIGMLFNRYYSLVAGIIMVFIGMWLDRIDDNNDSFLIYLCGIVTALFPFLMPA